MLAICLFTINDLVNTGIRNVCELILKMTSISLRISLRNLRSQILGLGSSLDFIIISSYWETFHRRSVSDQRCPFTKGLFLRILAKFLRIFKNLLRFLFMKQKPHLSQILQEFKKQKSRKFTKFFCK